MSKDPIPKERAEAQMRALYASTEMEGGAMTHRQKVFKEYDLEDKSYSLKELSDITKVPLKILQEVYNRGIGAYKTQPKSVRLKGSYVKNVNAPMSRKLSKEAWAFARTYSFLDGNPKHDNDLRANKEEGQLRGGILNLQDNLIGPYAVLKAKMIQEHGANFTLAKRAEFDRKLLETANILKQIGTLIPFSGRRKRAKDRVFDFMQEVRKENGRLEQIYKDRLDRYLNKNPVINPEEGMKRLDYKLIEPQHPISQGAIYGMSLDPISEGDLIYIIKTADGWTFENFYTKADIDAIKKDYGNKDPITRKPILQVKGPFRAVYKTVDEVVMRNPLRRARGKSSSFQEKLKEIGLEPTKYLDIVKKKAKHWGYDPSCVDFSSDGVHKIEIKTPDGKVVRFGRIGYNDVLMWTVLELNKKVKSGMADQKQKTFWKSHSKMKGDWKDNDYSPNWLSMRLLW